MGFLYKFINKDNSIIYIGKTDKNNIYKRLSNHNHLPQECYEEIDKIFYSQCDNLSDLAVLEPYFINIYHPKYNKEFNYFDETLSFKINITLKWKELDYKALGINFMPLSAKEKIKLSEEEIEIRQKIGIQKAKEQGKYKGRKRIQLPEKEFEKAVNSWKAGDRTATSVFKDFGISSQTFYRRVHELDMKKENV